MDSGLKRSQQELPNAPANTMREFISALCDDLGIRNCLFWAALTGSKFSGYYSLPRYLAKHSGKKTLVSLAL